MKNIYDDNIYNFKTDSEGKTVFFANGLTKLGYIIPDKEKKNEIKKILSKKNTIIISSMLIWYFIIRPSLINFVIFMVLFCLIHFGWYRRKIDQVIEGLQVSEPKPKLAPINTRIGIGLIGAIAIILLISGAWLPHIIIRSGGIKGIMISISLFFFVLIIAIIGVYFLMVKKNKKKTLENFV